MNSLLQKAIRLFSENRKGRGKLVELNYQPKILNSKRDQKKVFELARELVKAQFELADKELSKRLWEDVARQNIDPERIINLMYTCHSHNEIVEMIESDSNYLKTCNAIK